MDKRDQTGAESKRRILDAAAKLFREQGYAAVSLRAIARDSGMKAGSLYYHFESKEDLLVAILDQGILYVHAEVQAAVDALDDPDGRTLLATAVRAHLSSLLRQSDYTSANVRVFGQAPEIVRERARGTRRAYENLWDSILKRGRETGHFTNDADLDAARLMIIGALNATLDWFDPERGSVDALADRYTDLLWSGLQPRAEERPH